MNLYKLSYKILFQRFSSFTSALLLITFGYILISAIVFLDKSFNNYISKNLKGIDMVVGAEGSPLQLILSSVLHVDFPTGNIKIKDLAPLFKNSLIKSMSPILLGDNYQGFRIIGTDSSITYFYPYTFMEGRNFEKSFEVILGHEVAKKTRLKIGDTFFGSHGLKDDDVHVHEEQNLVVVGIMNPLGSIADNLIFTHFQSVWDVHSSHNPSHLHDDEKTKELHEEHGHIHSEPHEHGPDCNHNHDNEHEQVHHEKLVSGTWKDYKQEAITACLIKYKSPMAAVQLPRLINELPNIQAASPIFEIGRLKKLFNFFVTFVQMLGALIILISMVNMVIALYNLVNEKKYELIMIRVMGGTKLQLASIPLFLGFYLASLSIILGWFISKSFIFFISQILEKDYFVQISIFESLVSDLFLGGFTLTLVLIASLLPALKLFTIDPYKILSKH